jgi:hypothetical protein
MAFLCVLIGVVLGFVPGLWIGLRFGARVEGWIGRLETAAGTLALRLLQLTQAVKSLLTKATPPAEAETPPKI